LARDPEGPIEQAREDRLRAIRQSERRIDKAQEAAIEDYISALRRRLGALFPEER
jgi:hypothetical protein